MLGVCIDDEGFDGLLECGATYTVRRTLPCQAVEVETEHGLVICSRERFELFEI